MIYFNRSTAGSVDITHSVSGTPSRSGSSRLDVSRADSSILTMIAGSGGVLSPTPIYRGRSSSSLESEDPAPSVANSDLIEEDEELGDDVTLKSVHSR